MIDLDPAKMLVKCGRRRPRSVVFEYMDPIPSLLQVQVCRRTVVVCDSAFDPIWDPLSSNHALIVSIGASDRCLSVG